MNRTAKGMRRYWDEAAKKNAAWYVDTSIDYANPDMEEFFASGRKIAAICVERSPTELPGRALAVEIGSGLGRNCLALTQYFDRVIGVDISPEMVRRSRELVDDRRVSFELGDGASLGAVADGCADLVMSFTVFQHIPDEQVIAGYLSEAARILRPGGVLAFQWNNQRGARWWKVRRAVLSTLQRSRIWPERHGRNAAEFLGSRVSLATINDMLERAGMAVTGTEGLGTLFACAWARKSNGSVTV